MALLTADMKRVVEEQRLGFFATVCADGTPNVSPKGTIAVWDDDHLVFDEWEEGQRRGVEGSPHFFCKGMNSFCPSLDISREKHGNSRIRLDRARLDRFLAACFVEGEDGLEAGHAPT